MKYTLLLNLPGKTKILFNRRNWVVQRGSINNRTYFSSLEEVCDELFDERFRAKAHEVRRVKNFLRSIQKIAEEARQTAHNDLVSILKAVREREDGDFPEDFDRRVHG